MATTRHNITTLYPGDVLAPGKSIFSASGKYELIYQTDGNLVIYLIDWSGRHPIWATATNNTSPKEAVMQKDGNFVVYISSGKPSWSTGTHGKPGAYLVMQDDGNLVVYLGSPIPTNALWASNTVQANVNTLHPGESLTPERSIFSSSGKFELIYQGDGNLVIYQIDGSGRHPIWATATNCSNPKEAIMQTDGNFVVYVSSGKPTWATGTNGKPGAYVTMQDDGNLVVYLGSPTPSNAVWASNTVR